MYLRVRCHSIKPDNIKSEENQIDDESGEAMEAKSEVTIKFSGSLPTATPVANKKVAIELTDQNGIVFTAQVNAKSWRKAETSASEFADWAGAVSGKLGQRTENGFEVIDAGIQLFEKKAKEVKADVGAAVGEAAASS
ncbi:hypothetical protein ACEYW6_33985 [Nostoc sp. UIC 10607]|uniref:hypothetical protein n=1 Tax=Nostoc sp. UIC 10607 TaxID=3045935 RepID=UPI00399FBA37